MNKPENYVREFYDIFFAQKRVILWTTLIFFIFAVLIAFLWPPTYSATGSIHIKGKKAQKAPSSLTQTYEQFYPVTKEDLVSEEQTLMSFEVAKNTLKYLKEKKLYKKSVPSFISSIFNKSNKHDIGTKKKGTESLPKDFINEVYGIMDGIKTEVVPSSNVIRIVFFDSDPAYAITVVNTLMNQYLIYRQEVNNPGQEEYFYHEQAMRFKTLIGKNEQALLTLAKNSNISNPDLEINNNLLLKKDLLGKLSSLKRDFIEKQMYVKHLEKSLASKKIKYFSYITYDQSKIITDMSGRLLDAYVERENALKTYKAKSRNITLINRKIKALSTSLKKEVLSYKQNQVNELNTLKMKIDFIEKKLKELDKRNLLLKSQVIKAKSINRDITLFQTSYTTLQKREEEARINSAVNTTNLSYFTIISKAYPSNGPVFPKKRALIPLGILIGFIIGCSFGFMREYFDHTFKKPCDVEEFTGLPVLFSIPRVEGNRMKRVLVFACIAVLVASAAIVIRGLVLYKYHPGVSNSLSIYLLPRTNKIDVSPAVIIPASYEEKRPVKIINATGKIRISSLHKNVFTKKQQPYTDFSQRGRKKKIVLKNQRTPITFLR